MGMVVYGNAAKSLLASGLSFESKETLIGMMTHSVFVESQKYDSDDLDNVMTAYHTFITCGLGVRDSIARVIQMAGIDKIEMTRELFVPFMADSKVDEMNRPEVGRHLVLLYDFEVETALKEAVELCKKSPDVLKLVKGLDEKVRGSWQFLEEVRKQL